MIFRRRTRGSSANRGMEIDDTVLTASEQDVARMEFRMSQRWLTYAFVLMVAALGLITVRLTYITTIDAQDYRATAARNSMRYDLIPAPRGRIFAYDGTALVENIPQTDVILVLAHLPRDHDRLAETYAATAHLVGTTESAIAAVVDAARADGLLAAKVGTDIGQETVYRVIVGADDIPALRLISTARRHYVNSSIFAHVMGYTGIVRAEDLATDDNYAMTDEIGKAGIERAYEMLLRGRSGYTGTQVDARGRAGRTGNDRTPISGTDLYLTIDSRLQKLLHDALVRNLEQHNLTRASAVAIDPRDGSVRALVSIPSYDNNLFVGGITTSAYTALVNDVDEPLFNRAIAGAYPPASTVKPLLSVAALDSGIIDETTTVVSTGAIRVGGTTFRDWRVNGVADVRRAIATSHDIFFYAIGGGYGHVHGMKMDTMKHYYNAFGLGSLTGIDLPGERPGFIPSPQWKQETLGERWTIGNDYHAAIGQGYVTATPLQMAMATAAIANGGIWWRPHVLAYERDMEGKVTSFVPERRMVAVDPRWIAVAREGMRMTVTEGTAQSLRTVPVTVAAKTGTAQFGTRDKTHAWLTSFAPYENPEIVIAVIVEALDPGTPSLAVMVSREVLTTYFDSATRDSDNRGSVEP